MTMRLGAILALAVMVAPALRAEVILPSGLDATLMEGFVEVQPDGARWARFRYVMPALAAPETGFDQVQADFVTLCEAQARPMLQQAGEEVALIIVSLMDKPMEFGQSDPGTVQYFESFAIRDDRCIWEEF
jgi:hypothetical protein